MAKMYLYHVECNNVNTLFPQETAKNMQGAIAEDWARDGVKFKGTHSTPKGHGYCEFEGSSKDQLLKAYNKRKEAMGIPESCVEIVE